MMDWEAIWLSLKLALFSTLSLMPLGIILAWPMAYGRYYIRIALETIVSLSLVLPPTVVGFYFIIILGPKSFLGELLERTTGNRLLFTFKGLLLTQIIINLPFFIQPLVAALECIDQNLIEAASTLGSGKIETYCRVSLPIAWKGLLAGLIFSFTRAIGEFGVVLIIGGNIPGITRTASVALYENIQAFEFSAAHQTALILFGIAFMGTICTGWLRSKK
jgi:molybdate transport system permease protein